MAPPGIRCSTLTFPGAAHYNGGERPSPHRLSMRKRPSSPRGKLVTLRHDSRILADNPLGDPHERDLPVWLPPGYRATGKRHYPVLFDLTGFTGAGPAHVGWKAFDENVPERLERLTATNGLLAVIDKQIDDLAALEPPSDISDDVDAMLDTARTAADTVREQGAGFWLEESDPFTEVNQRAAALGLDACAGDSAS